MENINFYGRREVLYGLKRASECARAAEQCRAASFGPRPQNRSELENANKAFMKIYLDMACFDESFTNTISHMENKDILELAKNLKSEYYQYGEIKPLDVFRNAIKAMFKVHQKGVSIKPVNDFIKNISKECKQM